MTVKQKAEGHNNPSSPVRGKQVISGGGVTKVQLLVLVTVVVLAAQLRHFIGHPNAGSHSGPAAPVGDYSSWVHVEMVLDDTRSIGYGSETWRDIKDGYNAWLERVKPSHPTDRVTWTLAKFDAAPRVEGPEMQPIAAAEQLNEKNYLARGGSTALYRSTLERLQRLRQWVDSAAPDDQRPGMIWVVVLTDGQDNNPGGRESKELREELEALKAELVYKEGFTPEDQLPHWQFEMVGLREEAEQELDFAMDKKYMHAEVEKLKKMPDLSAQQRSWLSGSGAATIASARTYSMYEPDGSARSALKNSAECSENMAMDIKKYQAKRRAVQPKEEV